MKKLLLLALVLFIGHSAFAQGRSDSHRKDRNRNGRVLVETSKPYEAVINRIREMGGTVHYRFKNIDALVVTVPEERLDALRETSAIGTIIKDDVIALTEPPPVQRLGYGVVPRRLEIAASEFTGDVVPWDRVDESGYSPVEARLVTASRFWELTGHRGEGVVIGIMDSGVAPVPALGNRVIGGESFLSVDPDIDDGLPATSPLNDAHGTWVATTAAAGVTFGISPQGVLAQALLRYLPEAVFPVEGILGLPLVGPAPAAGIYALKIFNTDGFTTTSIVLAAFDRAVELKELADAGDPSGVNLGVLNGSFGSATNFAAYDPFFAGMVKRLNEAGIVTVFSAGNTGPGGLTISDPGTARNTLTVGATSVAAYEKIFIDVLLGPGLGELWRANDRHITALFSSRGPTADGRPDPDIVAPGDYILAQGPTGSLSLVSGSSFAAPIVAGIAALLRSAFPDATPDEIRGALLAGADPDVLQDDSDEFDQGFGFVDAAEALEHFGARNPRDRGLESPLVNLNVRKAGVRRIHRGNHIFDDTGWLLPGQRGELFVDARDRDIGMTVTVSVVAELPPDEQNQLFGDDAYVAIHSAKTHVDDYIGDTPAFVSGTQTFTLDEYDMEEGLIRVTVVGDPTNAGRVRASVRVDRESEGWFRGRDRREVGLIRESEIERYELEVRPGTESVDILLDWLYGWDFWPTNDLDLLILDPDGNPIATDANGDGLVDGATLDVPERLTLNNPTPGTYTVMVNGFTVWKEKDIYELLIDVDGHKKKTWGWWAHQAAAAEGKRPTLSSPSPNPFNPTTLFTMQLPRDEHVRVEVFDVLGRRVALVNDGVLPSGEQHTFRFDAASLPSGLYIIRASGETFVETQEALLLK